MIFAATLIAGLGTAQVSNEARQEWWKMYLFNYASVLQYQKSLADWQLARLQPPSPKKTLMAHWSLSVAQILDQEIVQHHELFANLQKKIENRAKAKENDIYQQYYQAKNYEQKALILSRLFANQKTAEAYGKLATKTFSIAKMCIDNSAKASNFCKKNQNSDFLQDSGEASHFFPETLSLLKKGSYSATLHNLYSLTQKSPHYRVIYLAVQTLFSQHHQGDGKVFIENP